MIVNNDQKVFMRVDYTANVFKGDQHTRIGKFSFDENMNWKFTSHDSTITWRSGLQDLILAERLFFKQYATELFGVSSE